MSSAIVASLRAADRGADVDVRVPIVSVATQWGWPPVVHRLDVAGRALAFDLAQTPSLAATAGGPDADELTWAHPFECEGAVAHLDRWSSPSPALGWQPVGDDDIWMLLAGVDHLRRRLEYPPQVVS